MPRIEHLKKLFSPTSIAVVGASNEPGHPGSLVMRNLLSGRFLGPVMPVHAEQEEIHGQESYSEIDTLPLTPDMAVICTRPEQAPDHLIELGKRGTHAALILSHGEFRATQKDRDAYHKNLTKIADEHQIRMLGPNCLGFINPTVGVNASLAHRDAKAGRIAFVSQSDALFTSVLDWATSKGIGFSHLISLGDRADIHFGHILDFLNSDYHTRAVMLYMETIIAARAFMSAARAAARNKPVLVIKAGASPEGSMAAAAHSGALLGADDVYDAAISRAGMLRVSDINDLFNTVETLAHTKRLQGHRLAILTNGGGPGFLAVDALIMGGGEVAAIGEQTRLKLDEQLHSQWSSSNPLVIRSTAPPELYAAALETLLADQELDAILVMHVPTAAVSGTDVAEAVIKVAKKKKKNVLTSWLGIDDAVEARSLFTKAGIPTYFTPEQAIRAFLNMVRYQKNQEMLMETPDSLPEDFVPEPSAVKDVVQPAVEENRFILDADEAMQILTAYDIPAAITRVAVDEDEAVLHAQELGYPLALKVLSRDIQRKSQAGGIALDIMDEEGLRASIKTIHDRVTEHHPEARVQGYILQPMSRRAQAHELRIEVAADPVFGPTIHFGQGGYLAELVLDDSVSLPPLNMSLALEQVSRTRIHQLLKGSLSQPGADIHALCQTLVKVSQLIIDTPEIFELEINPLLADQNGVLALDAQIRVAKAKGSGADQLAIRPYPKELEDCVKLKDGSHVHLLPIRPEDEHAHWEFIDSLSAEDMRFRFFGYIGDLPRTEMTKFTHIDYDREMAFIAKGEAPEGGIKTLGVVRAMTSPDNSVAEFAIAIRSDLKRKGLGRVLMDKIIRYCRNRGTNRLTGQALSENAGMVGLAKAMGFDVRKDYEEDIYDFRMYLNPSE